MTLQAAIDFGLDCDRGALFVRGSMIRKAPVITLAADDAKRFGVNFIFLFFFFVDGPMDWKPWLESLKAKK